MDGISPCQHGNAFPFQQWTQKLYEYSFKNLRNKIYLFMHVIHAHTHPHITTFVLVLRQPRPQQCLKLTSKRARDRCVILTCAWIVVVVTWHVQCVSAGITGTCYIGTTLALMGRRIDTQYQAKLSSSTGNGCCNRVKKRQRSVQQRDLPKSNMNLHRSCIAFVFVSSSLNIFKVHTLLYIVDLNQDSKVNPV